MKHAIYFAHAFVKLGRYTKRPLTHLQLQKLVYIAHGFYLAECGVPLIEEPIEAWKYGPVISEMYAELKPFGSQPILRIPGMRLKVGYLDREEFDHAQIIFDLFAGFSGMELITLTHAPEGPWFDVYHNADSGMKKIIPQDKIKDYFTKLLVFQDEARAHFY